tara:strand:- start:466 stop:2010 length:1545 start_codon:yes stop_codon:yes gene_type:complete
MKNLVVLVVAFLATSVYAQQSDIEEIVIVGSTIKNGFSDPETDNLAIEAIEPIKIYAPGGRGGFIGATLNGTDVKNTAVFRNGIPVNDPGSGWYDFGVDIPSYQSYKVISGPNSVLFGSSSMAGTVLIEDEYWQDVLYSKGGEDQSYVMFGNKHLLVSRYHGTSGSVMTDNSEDDWFKNTTLRSKMEWQGFQFLSTVTDYEYEYDNCYAVDWSNTDECKQNGTKLTSSIRNDWLTLGYSRNDTEHLSAGDKTWQADNDRYYIDAKESIGDFLLGATYQKEKYNDLEDERPAVYVNWQNTHFGVGYRREESTNIFRFGLDLKGVKFSLGNSFRSPNLYERFGDDWVGANPSLKPEEGKGAEISYSKFTAWRYEFDEGIDFDFMQYQYINSGEYTSTGIKYANHIITENGSWYVLAQYTDTDKLRVPKYQTKISYYNGWGDFDYMIEYVGAYDKGLEFDGRPIDDMSTFNFNLGYYFDRKYRLGLQIKDIMNRHFEILPGYSAGGRELTLSLDVSI